MTSVVTGLPDRYRPLDEVGPEETTATGVIRCWRAKDRILNRDVAIRVHSPGGPAARGWISRALTAGGLATPALAMVYDAAEGTAGGAGAAEGGPAYVVNEWIEGQTLAERLAAGPMGEREVRTVLRRLAEGVAEAHRVGLAVGGIDPDTVVLRPNGLVGLRAVPAATATMPGDIAALGALLEFCLTGRRPDPSLPGAAGPPAILQPDLAALVRRARSTEPGSGLSSAAAMAALLAQPPRPSQSALIRQPDESESGWLRRLRERRIEEESLEDDAPGDETSAIPGYDQQGAGRGGLPPVPPPRGDDQLLPLEAGFGTEDHDAGEYDAGEYDAGEYDAGEYQESAEDADDEQRRHRRRMLVVALPLLALAVVVGLAWWIGSSVLSIAGSSDGSRPSPPATAPAPASPPEEEPPAPEPGPPASIASAEVYDPQGDGAPENDDDVPLTFDGDPATSWSTVNYFNNPAFGGLKEGVGVAYDLGTESTLTGVTVSTGTPGAAVEIRVSDSPGGALDSWTVIADSGLDGTTELTFTEPVTTRHLLVWVTALVPGDGGYWADITEVTLQSAG